jgi:hypothetical protein
MSDWLMKVIRAEADRLLELAADDDELRADLRVLARRILDATEETKERVEPSAAAAAQDTPGHNASAEVDEPLRELTLGRPRSESSQASPHPTKRGGGQAGQDDDLARLESRCRAKGEVARSIAERLRDMAEGQDLKHAEAPHDPELATWGEKLTNAYYWTRASEATADAELSILSQAAGCFEAVAEAAALVRAEEGKGKSVERSLRLLAEAQSALRRVLLRLNIPDDSDQEGVYEWVRATAARYRIYLRRHMRADDLADPAGWRSLLARIDDARSSGRRTPEQAALLDRIRVARDSIREGKASDEDWPAILEAVDRLIASGFPPSGRELREMLIPVLDDMPDRDELPRGVHLVFREIDRYQATRSHAFSREPEAEPTAEVRAVARLLAGKSLVLIGGSRRRETEASLKKAFGLRSILWVETKEHQSVDSFEPVVARHEVALVLLAIRWSSHAFGDVRAFCQRHGKPLVRLPGGYSPNQVANQILAQGSEQLEDLAGAVGPDERG